MNKIGKYKIIVDKQLIIIYFSGNIDVDDLINLQKNLHSNPAFDASFDVIADFRDCLTIVSQDDIARYVQFMKDNISYYQKRKGAYLTCKPNQVVATTLFSIKLSELPIEIKIFSSIGSIVHWLYARQIDFQFIENTLSQLGTQPNIVFEKLK